VAEKTKKLAEALEKHCRFSTTPVAVRLAKQGETPPEKTRYPVKDLGNRLSVCQGMSIARTFGWSMAFRDEDHACPLPRIFMGHRKPDTFLEGVLGEFYQEDIEYMKEMEASYSRWPLNSYQEIWLSPVDRCRFVPDLVVAYGSPAQVLTLIQAANFRRGPGIEALSTGRYGCSVWLAGVPQTGECTYMVPGPGERVFAGTQDHEMSFAIPHSRFDNLVDGLQYVRSRGSFRYPVPNLSLLSEPRIPPKYHEIVRES
jgi:uncharacterized protein (DUF169 family)